MPPDETGLRRRDVLAGIVAGVPALPTAASGAISPSTAGAATVECSIAGLELAFTQADGRVFQHGLLPVNSRNAADRTAAGGVEISLQISGEDDPDPGAKQSVGSAGRRLVLIEQRHESVSGRRRIAHIYSDPVSGLELTSIYEAVGNAPVLRRWVEAFNPTAQTIGIDYLSSAMLHGLADIEVFETELTLHVARNSWMAEGQWQAVSPARFGLARNGNASLSCAHLDNVGSWSSKEWLPMAMLENTRRGLTWFWQIEHNGSWRWELSNTEGGDDIYVYLGGPDTEHGDAWTTLAPRGRMATVPVAVGCVAGGFDAAVEALTRYRRLIAPPQTTPAPPVIFNDYMNCLWGNPSEAKTLPLIDAAAAAGCETYVIDAGWYAPAGQDWSATMGAWTPDPGRWPHGLRFVTDRIRARGMAAGLWLEIEAVGAASDMAKRPDDWFLTHNGRRTIKNGRLLLDFRNLEVRAHADATIDRLVGDLHVDHFKIDYNRDSLDGADRAAQSPGQGLLAHNRAVLGWLEGVRRRYPNLTIESCASGGNRMDYAMLSRAHLQSCSDQDDYRRLAAIHVGASAAVLPEQLTVWAYPKASDTEDAAAYSMVTAMLGRPYLSGELDKLEVGPRRRVEEAVSLWKAQISGRIAHGRYAYPLGMPAAADVLQPLALALHTPDRDFVAVWRREGLADVRLPLSDIGGARLLYPMDMGATVSETNRELKVNLPRPYTAALFIFN